MYLLLLRPYLIDIRSFIESFPCEQIMQPNKFFRNELSNYVDVKREILRLDFVAQGLRKTLKQTEAESEKERHSLRQMLVSLEDEEQALDAFVLAEEKRAIDTVQTVQSLQKERTNWEAQVSLISKEIEQLQRDIVRMSEMVDNSAQYRAFLIKLAGNNTSKLGELLRNPEVLISEAQKKENDVISCAVLIQQLARIEAQYETHAHRSEKDTTNLSKICKTKCTAMPEFQPSPPCEFGEPAIALIRQIFRTTPENFTASRCTEISDMFAVIERYLFSLLDAIEEYEAPHVEKIIRRVVVLKKKRAEAEKQQLITQKRQEREAKALERALAPIKKANKSKLAYKPQVPTVKPLAEQVWAPDESFQEDLSFLFEDTS